MKQPFFYTALCLAIFTANCSALSGYIGPQAPNSAFTDTAASKPPSAIQIGHDYRAARRAQRQENFAKIRAAHPAWADHPAWEFSTAADGFFAGDRVANDRYELIMARYVGATGDPPRLRPGRAREPEDAVFDSVRADVLDTLRERPDLQALWDRGFGDREMWRKLYRLRPDPEEL
ncbi:hypothetical protein PG995_008094 [Apiospora arundinis]